MDLWFIVVTTDKPDVSDILNGVGFESISMNVMFRNVITHLLGSLMTSNICDIFALIDHILVVINFVLTRS